MALILVLLAILIGICGAAYLYFANAYTYWKKRGVAHVKPSFPGGNIGEMMLSRKSLGEIYKEIYDKLKPNKFGGFYQLHKPVLITLDPELIKQFLVKDFEHFHDRGFLIDEKLDPLAAHLFLLNGLKWKNSRAKLTPTFTSGKMKMMFQTLVDCGKELSDYLEKSADTNEILEFKEISSRFTTDVIASCAFGIQCNCLKNPDAEFRYWGRKIFEPSLNQLMRGLLYIAIPKVAIFLGISNIENDINKFFITTIRETVQYREKNNIQRNDFLKLLIQLKNEGFIDGDKDNSSKTDRIEMSETELVSHVFMFFAAGFETSSATMSFCLYELAINQDIQEKLRNEIDRILLEHGGNITYESIKEMTYLNKTVSETLRKYPTVTMLNRHCTKEYRIPDTDIVIEKGIELVIPVLALQHDPKYFPEPEKFDPERFNEEEINSRHHFTYLPFGEGPRNCIGMRFGLMQTKVGLVSTLLKYEFHLSEETEVPLKFDPKSIFLFPNSGIKLLIKKRKT